MTFQDLDITMEDGIFIYELFAKRDKFLFLIVWMSSLSSSIPSSISYGLKVSEFF